MPDKKMLAGGALLAGAAFWFYVKPTYMDSSAAAEPVVYTDAEIAAAPRPTLTLEERVLNLANERGRTVYLRVGLALEFEDHGFEYIELAGEDLTIENEHFMHEMEPELHRIWDVVTEVIGAHTAEEVADVEGRDLLKQELIDALNEEIHGETVEGVYFTSFVTQ